MNAQDLKNSILQLAIQGKLVEQREEEGTAKELLKKIDAEKKLLIKEGKIKKQKALPEIKDDEIPFDIPESWEWVRLIDLSLFIKAGGDKPKDFLKSKTETHTVPVIANGIQNDGIIGYTKKATVEKSCITVSGRGTIGFSCLRTEPFTPVVRLLVINISDQLDNKYVQNVLTALLERGVGTSIKQLTVPMIEPKIIPLPPLEEQKRIVAKIEELMPYVDKYDVAYSEVEELNKKFPEDMQKSILQYAIQGKLVEQRKEDGTAEDLYKQIQEEKKKLIKEGKIKKTKALPEITEDEIPFDIPESWKWIRLETITYSIGNKSNQIKQSEILQEGRYPVVSQSMNRIEGYSNEENKLLKIEPLSVIVFGDHSKTLKLIDFDFIIGADGTKIMVPISLDPEYLYYVLNYNVINMRDRGYSRHFQFLKERPIPLPPLAEQKRIVEKIEELLSFAKQLVK